MRCWWLGSGRVKLENTFGSDSHLDGATLTKGGKGMNGWMDVGSNVCYLSSRTVVLRRLTLTDEEFLKYLLNVAV